MNETVNRLLLAGDKFMPEIHLKLPRFTYSACGPFTKNKERTQIFKEINEIRLAFNIIWLMKILKI